MCILEGIAEPENGHWKLETLNLHKPIGYSPGLAAKALAFMYIHLYVQIQEYISAVFHV